MREKQTSPRMAKAFLKSLIGDSEWTTPSGTPAYSYFALMDLNSAHKAYEEIHQLPEADRMRDLLERLGEDGRLRNASRM